MGQATHQVFVVIPAYNEEANLPRLLSQVGEVLTSMGVPFTLLVVNDGSQDDTAGAAERLSATLPVEVLHHPRNLGVGAVFRTGLGAACAQAADGDIIVLMEADGTNDPATLPLMLSRLREHADLVIASRYRRGGGYHGFPWRRLMLSLGANSLMRFRFPMAGVRDYTIFYRAYRAELLREAFVRYGDRLMECDSFACNAELLVKLRTLRPRITEVPTSYRYELKRGGSKLPALRTIAEYLTCLVAKPFNRQREPVAQAPEATSGVVPARISSEAGFTVWLTGLPSSGKTTLARLLETRLDALGRTVEVLDGDEVRQTLTRGLGFSRADRDENIFRIAQLAARLTHAGAAVIVAAVSPYRQARDNARLMIGPFVEVHVDCPVAVCIRRDVKGMYRQALRGERLQFTGVSDPYEPPDRPELVVHTDVESPDESVERIVAALLRSGYLSTPLVAHPIESER